jgi:hypothetical protein
MSECDREKIVGYVKQSQNQVLAINYYKEQEIKLIADIQMLLDGVATFEPQGTTPLEVDKRWVSIAKTHFQEGFMAAVRAIARPHGD